MQCPHCTARINKNRGQTVTCGKSECQEAEFKANQLRNAPKKRLKLKPKAGARKADGTLYETEHSVTRANELMANGIIPARFNGAPPSGPELADVPGDLQKLEIKETPDEVKTQKLNDIIETLTRKLGQEQGAIASFVKNLAEDPARAFESSMNCFNAAARLRIYKQAFEAITDSKGVPELRRKKADGSVFNTLDYLVEYSQKEVNRRASSPPRSSSPTYNLMEQQYLAAWADILEIVLWS